LSFNGIRPWLGRPIAHFGHSSNALVERRFALWHDRLSLDVALADNFGNRAKTFGIGLEVGNMKKARLVETDIDECGLHPRQHPRHSALVNVACQAAALIALQIKFR